MIKTAAELLKDNYKKIGALTDKQFVSVQARACGKRLLHVEKILEIRRVDGGLETPTTINDVSEDDTIRIKATVRSMLGGKEKTGFITLNDIQEIYTDDSINMLIINAENMMVTTLECKDEVIQINAVLAGDNWVTEQSLSELIGKDATLRDFQNIRDQEPELELDDIVIEDKTEKDLDFSDFGGEFKTPDLIF